RRRTLLGAGLLTGAGVLSACGETPSSVCLAGEQEVDTGPVHTFPFIGAEPLRRQPQLGLLGLAVSPAGTRVAAHEWWHRKSRRASGTAATTIWDATTGEIITRFDGTTTGAMAWHPREALLAPAAQSVMHVSSPDGEVLWRLGG